MAGLMSWDATKHPRAKKGSAGGGQFAPLSYDSSKNTGTGYGKAQGDSRVKTTQTALNRLGLTDADGKPLKVDGKLGPKTTAAVKAWQRKNGVKPADGKITPAMLAKLKAAKPRMSKKALTKPRRK